MTAEGRLRQGGASAAQFNGSYALDQDVPLHLNGCIHAHLRTPDWPDAGSVGLVFRANTNWSMNCAYIYAPDPGSGRVLLRLARYIEGEWRRIADSPPVLALPEDVVDLNLEYRAGQVRFFAVTGEDSVSVTATITDNPFPGYTGVIRFYNCDVQILSFDVKVFASLGVQGATLDPIPSTGVPRMVTAMSVFVSYSHDSLEHESLVLGLATRLVEQGIDVELDQWVESPPEGWPRWMERKIRESSFVLVICTEGYLKRTTGDERPGRGQGARWESMLAYQQIYGIDSENQRFIPVVFRAEDVHHIPLPLQPATYYNLENDRDFLKLYRRLTGQPVLRKPELGRITPLSSSPDASSLGRRPKSSSGTDARGEPAGPTPSTASVRKLIINVLASDSDLDAFCLDYFEDVRRRFTDGMDRMKKVSILLEREDLMKILRLLERNHPDRFQRFQHLLRDAD